jgi:16S rRNA U516 pseudouridylate synthase RsuA-like enzyme
MGLMPVVVNGCWPERPGLEKTPAMAARSQKVKLSDAAKQALASSAGFGKSRLEGQHHQVARLGSTIGLPMATLPRLPTPRLTLHHLGELADALVLPLAEYGKDET